MLTTGFVLDELFDTQYQSLLPYIESERLIVHAITEDDLHEIYSIQVSKPALSEQDCSAFYQAQKVSATLLTSDNNLRNYAKAQKLEVHGHLWVFDRMVEAKTISGTMACEKLNELCDSINPKLGLPETACAKRKQLWSKN